jgi:hypothetical protein
LADKLEKILQITALFWLGLRKAGILQIFFALTVLKRTIVDFSTFFRPGLMEKIAVCAHTTHLLKK